MFHSPFDQPGYKKPAKKKKKKAKARKKAKKAAPKKAKRRPAKVSARKKAPARPGFPHENVAPGQHWSFVYHGQYGYLITHGKVISRRGERCHIKPARGAASTWIPDSRGEKQASLANAGAMVECHSPGDLVQSRLVEPYTGKAQFKCLATRLRKVYKANPATKERLHVKDKPYETFRKTVAPVLKKVDRLLTKRSLGLVQEAADERLEAALEAHGPADTGFVQSLRLYYVPLAENLQAELAAAKQAAAAMRARATRQKDYNAATKGFTRASWEITENILRVSDLMKWGNKRLHKKALDLFHELTETLRPGRALASNPHPERWRVNPQGFLFPARRI